MRVELFVVLALNFSYMKLLDLYICCNTFERIRKQIDNCPLKYILKKNCIPFAFTLQIYCIYNKVSSFCWKIF